MCYLTCQAREQQRQTKCAEENHGSAAEIRATKWLKCKSCSPLIPPEKNSLTILSGTNSKTGHYPTVPAKRR